VVITAGTFGGSLKSTGNIDNRMLAFRR